MATPVASTAEAAEFVTAFTDVWAHPTPDGLAGLATEDVVLSQPVVADLHGRERWREDPTPLLAAIVTRPRCWPPLVALRLRPAASAAADRAGGGLSGR